MLLFVDPHTSNLNAWYREMYWWPERSQDDMETKGSSLFP